MQTNPPNENESDINWRQRFKGRVESINHTDDALKVVVQLYALPRPPSDEFSRKAAPSDEQLLYFNTVDPSVHLSLRVAARRTVPDSASVSVEVRSNRLPALHQPGHLTIQLSAGGQAFTKASSLTNGVEFADVPIASLGDLRVELDCSL